MKHRRFVAYFFRSSFYYINLGIGIDLSSPNIEIHLPFGFIRIGWSKDLLNSSDINYIKEQNKKVFGYIPKGYY